VCLHNLFVSSNFLLCRYVNRFSLVTFLSFPDVVANRDDAIAIRDFGTESLHETNRLLPEFQEKNAEISALRAANAAHLQDQENTLQEGEHLKSHSGA